jgi:intracellular multiplication protein IcmE
MTDNFQEFEHVETEHLDKDGEPKTTMRSNLAGAWRSQPLFKLFVLIVVVGAVVAVLVSFFSGNNGKSGVQMAKPPDLHEAPGGKSSPYLQQQTEMANKERTDEAIQSGGSAMPTPLGPSTDNGGLNPAGQKEDPLNELHAEVENMNKQLQEVKQAQAAPPPMQAPAEPFDDSLAQAMQRQMGQMLDSWAPKGNRVVTVQEYDQAAQQSKDAAAAQAAATTGVGTSGAAAQAAADKVIVPAGTVSYAQMLTEANSDVPGPILAQIVSGPLKGARAVGQFQVTNGYSEYLVMTFRLADLNGKDYRINAIALDPDTTLGGMATEVDERYFTRLILPAAAAFLQGFGSAIGQGNSSIVTNGTTTIVEQGSNGIRQGEYQGIGAAAQTASQFFQNQANQTQPLVRVASGTPMGLFFVESVTENSANPQANNNNNNGNNPNGQGYPYGFNGNNPNGYPGAGIPGVAGYGFNGYGTPGYGTAGYGATNGYGSSGYPVLYPNALAATNRTNYLGSGLVPTTNTTYPGSTIYYTH